MRRETDSAQWRGFVSSVSAGPADGGISGSGSWGSNPCPAASEVALPGLGPDLSRTGD
jgi:hypothetical protein